MELTNTELMVLRAALDEFGEKLRKGHDEELGWDYEEMNSFYDLYGMVCHAAKERRL